MQLVGHSLVGLVRRIAWAIRPLRSRDAPRVVAADGCEMLQNETYRGVRVSNKTKVASAALGRVQAHRT